MIAPLPPVPALYQQELKEGLQKLADAQKGAILALNQLFDVSLAEANKGDVSAMFVVGHSYYHGTVVSRDYAKALAWFRKAATKGDARSQYYVGLIYYLGQGVPESETEARGWLEKAAAQGDPDGQGQLAHLLRYSKTVPQNIPRAVALMEKAAASGKHEHLHNLADAYRFGLSFPRELPKAIALFEKLANLPVKPGDDPKYVQWSWNALGVIYLKAEGGTPRNLEKARDYLTRAAQVKSPYSQYLLAAIYSQGLGVEKDEKEAARWMLLAANNNWRDAQSDWGTWLVNGKAGYKDPKEAVAWFKKAADQRGAVAAYNLGVLAEAGLGMEKSTDEARSWYKKAAEWGHAKAKEALTRLERL